MDRVNFRNFEKFSLLLKR